MYLPLIFIQSPACLRLRGSPRDLCRGVLVRELFREAQEHFLGGSTGRARSLRDHELRLELREARARGLKSELEKMN